MVHGSITKRVAQFVRVVSVAISLALIACAFYGGALIGGGVGFGWTQGFVLAAGIALGLSCLAKVQWNAMILVVYISGGLTLLIAEVLLSSLLGPRYFGVFELHPRYLYQLVPNSTREYNRQAINEKGRILYQINSKGFRGEEFVPGDAHRRIVVYGDSFIHAEFSVLKDTFTEQLEVNLSERLGKDVEIVNAGVAGYGPDQVVRRMEDELPWLKPDLVVVGIFAGNDYGDLIRSKLYKLDEHDELQENSFVVSEEIKRRRSLSREGLLLKMIVRDAVRSVKKRIEQRGEERAQNGRMRVNSFLRQNINEFEEYIIDGDNTVRELASDPYNADVSLKPLSSSAVYKKLLMSRVVKRMKDVAGKQSVPLVLLIIPHPMDVLNGAHDSGEVDLKAYPEYRPEALTDALQQIADDNNIPSLNLFDIYQQHDAAKLYYSGGDDHWNELGQEVAAKALAQHMVTRELIRR